MSERKVLNKYYPPDFDPTKIPRLKRPKNRQFCIRIMAPFNMRCATCGEYIYKGKKFNSRQERVEDEDYLGLMIFRFYIKCPRCVSEISFKTDPEKCDYALEGGATRNFEALRTAERLAEEEWKEKEEETKNNPMKVLENRTKASQQEMEMLETLEELREMNSRHAKVDHEDVLRRHKAYEEQLRKLQDDEDEEFIRSVFGKSSEGESIKRIHDDDYDDDSLSSAASTPKAPRLGKPSDILTVGLESSSDTSQDSHSSANTVKFVAPRPKKEAATWEKSVGGLSNKKSLLGIVKKKPSLNTVAKPTSASSSILTQPDNVPGKKDILLNGSAINVVEPKENTVVPTDKAVNNPDTATSTNQPETVVKASGLGMLGAYSDSDDSND